ncbi:MAG: prohibitin family protein [Rhodothermales bacterium]|nr:prohibitin family protein [Rhodothermales bacterium]
MATNPYPNLTRTLGRFGAIFGVVLVLLLIAAGCMTTSIGSGERGVKYSYFSGTELNASYGEGLHVFMPWESMIEYDVRVKSETEEVTALSSNGASIGMELTVRYRPDRQRLPELHQTYGRDYYVQLLQPVVRSAAREVVGRYTPEDLYSTRRDELEGRIAEQVVEGVGVGGEFLEVEAVLIRDVVLPEQVQRAIEIKLQEEQRVQQAALEVQRAEQEAERKRVEARGDADRARIITESLSPQFLQFQGIQATRELAQSDNAKVVIVGGGDSGLPVILGDQ